jgi:hypothetical protein
MLIYLVHNPQIPSTNNQIITNRQIPMTKYNLVIENWNLFGVWDLDIGI